MTVHISRQSGNVLFLVLIGVFLFAALSYAVTKLPAQSSSSISEDRAEIAASEIMQWLTAVRQAVNRMRVVNGVSIQTLDFRSGIFLDCSDANEDYTNNACSSTQCQVFHENGGAIHARTFSRYQSGSCADLSLAGGTVAPGMPVPRIVNIDAVGTSANEVVMAIHHVEPEVCRAFNRRNNVEENPSFDIFGEGDLIFRDDRPSDELDDAAHTYGDDYDDLDGERAFCTLRTLSGVETGRIIFVLIER